MTRGWRCRETTGWQKLQDGRTEHSVRNGRCDPGGSLPLPEAFGCCRGKPQYGEQQTAHVQHRGRPASGAAQKSAWSIQLLASSDNVAPALDLGLFGGTRWSWSSAGPKGGASMSTYVSLINWTDQGIKNYKDSTSRADDFSKLVESLGGRVRELLWTVGEYDLVTVTEFPDDETAAVALLRVGSLGSIRSNTLRAFSAEQMGSIIGRAG
jgi:uncharacterized protein with GYD domain